MTAILPTAGMAWNALNVTCTESAQFSMLAVCTHDHDQTTLPYHGGHRYAHDARRYRPRPRIRVPYRLLLCKVAMVHAPPSREGQTG